MEDTKTIYLKEVPEELHRKVKALAAVQGKTLRQTVLDLLVVATTDTSIKQWYETVPGGKPGKK